MGLRVDTGEALVLSSLWLSADLLLLTWGSMGLACVDIYIFLISSINKINRGCHLITYQLLTIVLFKVNFNNLNLNKNDPICHSSALIQMAG